MGYFDSIYASDLPPRAVNVYRYLKDRANKQNQCFPSMSTIARDLHISVSTVKRALNDLENAGFIQRTNRFRSYGNRTYGKTSNLYTVK